MIMATLFNMNNSSTGSYSNSNNYNDSINNNNNTIINSNHYDDNNKTNLNTLLNTIITLIFKSNMHFTVIINQRKS